MTVLELRGAHRGHGTGETAVDALDLGYPGFWPQPNPLTVPWPTIAISLLVVRPWPCRARPSSPVPACRSSAANRLPP
jgi:hypothetical protein